MSQLKDMLKASKGYALKLLQDVVKRILTKERARQHSEVVGNLIFLKENGHLLKEHYATLEGKETIFPNVCTDPKEIEEALELDED